MSAKFDFSTLVTGYESDWPVLTKLPIPDGTFVDSQFQARFRMVGETLRDEIIEQEKKNEAEGVKSWPYIEAFFVGLGEGETSPLAFEATRAAMCDREDLRRALIVAYDKFRSGGALGN